MSRRANLSLMFFRIRHPFRPSPIPTSPIPFPPSIHIMPTSKFHSFSKITRTHFAIRHDLRSFSGGSSELDHNKEVDTINLKFAEAREEIEMALESKDTVYFDEEAECARAAVNEVLSMFEGLLARLPEKDRGALQRSMGLKIEQLKAELQQLDE
ncbi:embryogenesis-like protein [Gastrolobium bilobum]|uniref:embryogenesis-like protein n=1 Tax=Gastrolobium bilobum TaxID=150636 RepID=UPI002AB1B47C|nr:embryogenesis-like protein [Gastrolobium bilobum]